MQVAEEICVYRYTIAYLQTGKDPEGLEVLYCETECEWLTKLLASELGMMA